MSEQPFRTCFQQTRMSREEINAISGQVIDAAIRIHKAFGPGLLESAYERALQIELRKRGLQSLSQVGIEVAWEGESVGIAFRADLVVEKCLIVELKSVETLLPVHSAQLLTYLKLSGLPLGLLINFNSERLKDGIRRKVNAF